MTLNEENKGSPLISQTDEEPPDSEIAICQTKSDNFDLIDQKNAKLFLFYILFSLSGFIVLILSFVFRSHINKTLLIVFYEIGIFLSLPILLIFFEAYHYFLQPIFNSLDDCQEKTELADIGA